MRSLTLKCPENVMPGVSVITTEPVDTLLQKGQNLEVQVLDTSSVTLSTITRLPVAARSKA